MPRDLEKQKTWKRRDRDRRMVAKYGPQALGRNMQGRHGNNRRGSQNHRWNSREKIISDEGYVKLRVGRDHPLADPNGYAYEHLIVWVSSGRPLPAADELIHHKDEDRKNNRLDNLELKTRSSHATLHNSERGRDRQGRFLKKAAGRLLDGQLWDQYPTPELGKAEGVK